MGILESISNWLFPRKDPKDARDYKFKDRPENKLKDLPEKVSLKMSMSQPIMQGRLGSCVWVCWHCNHAVLREYKKW